MICLELDNAYINYEEAIILPGLVEETPLIEECVFLPGVLNEFDNIEKPSESINAIETEAIVNDEIPYSPNCLSLTVVPDYKILSIKNVITQSARITYKVLFSTIVLNIIKLFC